jgi:hypothetical protein
MKIFGQLPDRKYFQQIESKPDIYLFEDRQTTALQIRSPVPDPWGQNWDIILSVQKQKADNSEYPYRIVLRLYPSHDGIPAIIQREYFKSVFASSNQRTTQFYAFPVASKGIPLWVCYSII